MMERIFEVIFNPEVTLFLLAIRLIYTEYAKRGKRSLEDAGWSFCWKLGICMLIVIGFEMTLTLPKPAFYKQTREGWVINGEAATRDQVTIESNDWDSERMASTSRYPLRAKFCYNATGASLPILAEGSGIVVVRPNGGDSVVLENHNPVEHVRTYDNVLREVNLKPRRCWQWDVEDTNVRGGHVVEYRIND